MRIENNQKKILWWDLFHKYFKSTHNRELSHCCVGRWLGWRLLCAISHGTALGGADGTGMAISGRLSLAPIASRAGTVPNFSFFLNFLFQLYTYNSLYFIFFIFDKHQQLKWVKFEDFWDGCQRMRGLWEDREIGWWCGRMKFLIELRRNLPIVNF